MTEPAYGCEITASLRDQGFVDTADGTPIRDIVGDDPVEFVAALARD